MGIINNIIAHNNLHRTIMDSRKKETTPKSWDRKWTKKERQEMDRKIPKCKCGNNLSVDRQKEKIDNCPACDPVNEVELLKDNLDDLTDEERYELFSNYCRDCGSKNPRCQCSNDE